MGKIFDPCGWNAQLLLLVIYEAVLDSVNERPSINVSSNDLARTSTIDICIPEILLLLRYRFVFALHSLSDGLVTLTVGICVTLICLFVLFLLELTPMEL